MVFGTSLFGPVTAAVIFYSQIKKRIKGNQINKRMKRIIALSILLLIAILIWDILDVWSYFGEFKEITANRLIENFKDEFLFGLIILIPVSILISQKYDYYDSIE
jgi:predicted membrane protein